jgi:hypothetical protein
MTVSLLGAPLFVVLGGMAILNFATSGTDLVVLSEENFKLATNPHLITIPLFQCCCCFYHCRCCFISVSLLLLS